MAAAFGEEALVHEVPAMRAYCAAAMVGLSGPDVEVAERVRRRPVAWLVLDDVQVLGDGGVELPLAEQLLRFLQRVFAIDGHLGLLHEPGSAGGRCGRCGPHGLHPIKQGRRPERTAMHVGIAEPRRPRRGGRASRSPCAGRSRSADRARAARASSDRASPWRGSTPRRSPCIASRRPTTARCAISRSGMRNPSTSTSPGSGHERQDRPLHRPQRRLMDVDASRFPPARRRPRPRRPRRR